MKFIKEYAGLVALVILAITSLLPLFSPQSFGASGTRFPNGLSADTTSPIVGEVRGTTLTITSGTTVNGSGTVINGTGFQAARDATLNVASTTLCSISYTATSSITNLGLLLTVGTTSAGTITFSTSTASNVASSSFLYSFPYAANSQASYVLIPTTTNLMVGPSSQVNITYTGGTGTVSPTGVCSGQSAELD